MSFLQGVLVAASLALAGASSANALVIPTQDGNYEFGGFTEPVAPRNAERAWSGNATWPVTRDNATF